MVAYKLTRPDCGGWMHAGVTPAEVACCIENELKAHEGMTADECGTIVIEPYETIQDEIDALPEFQGW